MGQKLSREVQSHGLLFLLSAAASGTASSAKCPSAWKEYWRLSIGLIAILFLKTDLLKGVDGMWTSKMAQCLERSITSVPACARCGFYQLQVIELSTYRNGRTANKPKLSEREMGGGNPRKPYFSNTCHVLSIGIIHNLIKCLSVHWALWAFISLTVVFFTLLSGWFLFVRSWRGWMNFLYSP